MGGNGSSRWKGLDVRSLTSDCHEYRIREVLGDDIWNTAAEVAVDGTLAKICRLPGRVGNRTFFVCPACGSCRAVLYRTSAGTFGCRGCLRLAHPSTRESWEERFFRRKEKLEDYVAARGGDLESGVRPPRMRWGTWWRLLERWEGWG